MDGVCRCVGSAIDVKLARKTYLCEPLTIGKLGIIEHHLLAARKNPLEAVGDILEAQPNHRFASSLAEMAISDIRKNKDIRVVRIAEIQTWIRTSAGMAFSAWLCLKTQRGMACEFLAALLASASVSERKECMRRLEIASGFDLLSSLDWPNSTGSKLLSYMPWKQTLRDFAESIFWEPKRVADMTLWQFKIFTSDKDALGGLGQKSPSDLLALPGMTAGQKGKVAGKSGTAGQPGGKESIRDRLVKAGKLKLRPQ